MDKIVKECAYRGCHNPVRSRGYCDTHYHLAVYNGIIITTPRLNTGKNVSKHKLYRCWASMKNRCYNKNDKKNYEWYGGRGIKVCDRWIGKDGFWNFVKDMGERPEGYSLDRINVDGDYCPENCRWASPKEQCYNRRNNLEYHMDGKKYNTEEAAAILGKNPETIRKRKRLGFSNEEVISSKNIVRNNVKVRCIETGEVFDSIMEAGRKNNISYQSISACIKGKQHTAAGKHFEQIKDELEQIL